MFRRTSRYHRPPATYGGYSLIAELGACLEAREFFATEFFRRPIREAYEYCCRSRPEWALWFVGALSDHGWWFQPGPALLPLWGYLEPAVERALAHYAAIEGCEVRRVNRRTGVAD